MRDFPIRILIVENHPMVADGLAALVGSQTDMVVVGNVRSVRESVSCASESRPDVVILDFSLDEGTGADAAVGIHAVLADAKVIFLTRHESDEVRFAATKAGASAFIPKSRAAAEVIASIRQVASGGKVITPFEISALQRGGRGLANPETLTKREKEMLGLMSRGVSTREIANRLGISYTTVRSHIRSASSKLAVHSKIEAVLKSRQMALID